MLFGSLSKQYEMLHLYHIAAGITVATFVNIFGLNRAALVFSVSVFSQCCLSLFIVSLPSFWCLSLWLTLCTSFCDWSATDELLCVVFCGVVVHLVTVVLVT